MNQRHYELIMKTPFSLLLIALALILCSETSIAQKEVRECVKRIRIQGLTPSGKMKTTVMTVKKKLFDFTEEERQKQLKGDLPIYEGLDYTVTEPPSWKMDCAGFTMRELYLTDKYWVTAHTFYESLVKPYGRRIGEYGDWGDVKPRDVLVYLDGERPTHIAFIQHVERTIVGDEPRIILTVLTKESQDAVYIQKMDAVILNENDPLIRRMRHPVAYRLPPDLDVNDAYYPDCNGLQDIVVSKPVYRLKDVQVNHDQTAFKAQTIFRKEVSATITNLDGTFDEFQFKLLNEPPETITSGTTFPLHITGISASAKWDYNVRIGWQVDKNILSGTFTDEGIMVGTNTETKKFTADADVTMNVQIPEFTGKELILTLRVVYATGIEASGYEWVRFIYEKK